VQQGGPTDAVPIDDVAKASAWAGYATFERQLDDLELSSCGVVRLGIRVVVLPPVSERERRSSSEALAHAWEP
jgi:hypothetical protein